MPDQPQVLTDLTDTVTTTVGVMESATVLIQGFQQREADAIKAALANGATAEQLAPLQALNDELKAKDAELAAAVAANAPASTPTA